MYKNLTKKINTYSCFQTLVSHLDWPHDSVSPRLFNVLRSMKKNNEMRSKVQNYKIYLQLPNY